jgi:hypothetical protein
VDIGFCCGSCRVVSDSEGEVLVASAAELLNNVGRVSGYALTMIIRATARIVNWILLSNAKRTTQCHQADGLDIRKVIR